MTPSVTISKTDEILVDGQRTGFSVGLDKDGAFLIHDDGTAGEGRHETKFDVARAFRFVFFV